MPRSWARRARKGDPHCSGSAGSLADHGTTGRNLHDDSGKRPENYCRQLRDAVAESHLQGVVEFHSPIPREQMPQVLAKHDVLILPSNTTSASEVHAGGDGDGVLVMGTTTGGSGELLVQ